MSVSPGREASQPKATGDDAIPSPCIGVCQLNRDQICTGCHRSIEEIARWSKMPDAERQMVMKPLRLVASKA